MTTSDSFYVLKNAFKVFRFSLIIKIYKTLKTFKYVIKITLFIGLKKSAVVHSWVVDTTSVLFENPLTFINVNFYFFLHNMQRCNLKSYRCKLMAKITRLMSPEFFPRILSYLPKNTP